MKNPDRDHAKRRSQTKIISVKAACGRQIREQNHCRKKQLDDRFFIDRHACYPFIQDHDRRVQKSRTQSKSDPSKLAAPACPALQYA